MLKLENISFEVQTEDSRKGILKNINLEIEDDCLKETILDKKVFIKDDQLKTRFCNLREAIKEIAKKIKEKI